MGIVSIRSKQNQNSTVEKAQCLMSETTLGLDQSQLLGSAVHSTWHLAHSSGQFYYIAAAVFGDCPKVQAAPKCWGLHVN